MEGNTLKEKDLPDNLQKVRDTVRTLYNEETVIVTIAASIKDNCMMTVSNAADEDHMQFVIELALKQMGMKMVPIADATPQTPSIVPPPTMH